MTPALAVRARNISDVMGLDFVFSFFISVLSEVLTLGLPDEHGNVVLLTPTRKVPNGGKMF